MFWQRVQRRTILFIVMFQEDLACSLHGATTTTSGTLVVDTFLQEDRVATPQMRELVLHPPKVLSKENAETIFHATTSGDSGMLLRPVLDALQAGTLKLAIILDTADCGAANLKRCRILRALVNRTCPAAGCLMKLCRCDGHMLHIAASVSLTRSSASGVLYSSALLLRSGTHKLHMSRAVHEVVSEKLEWYQGGDPDPSDLKYSRAVLKLTLLRHVSEENRPEEGSPAARSIAQTQALAEEVVETLNGKLTVARVSHRCKRLPNGRWCCLTRSIIIMI